MGRVRPGGRGRQFLISREIWYDVVTVLGAHDSRPSPCRIDHKHVPPLHREREIKRPHPRSQIDAAPPRPRRIFQLGIIHVFGRVRG